MTQLVDWNASNIPTALANGAHYEYSPYGGVIRHTGAYADENAWRFSTKPFDAESGLGYWGYRYYNTTLGRWLSRDPIGEDGGANVYAYARNVPVQSVDALGQKPHELQHHRTAFSCKIRNSWGENFEPVYRFTLDFDYNAGCSETRDENCDRDPILDGPMNLRLTLSDLKPIRGLARLILRPIGLATGFDYTAFKNRGRDFGDCSRSHEYGVGIGATVSLDLSYKGVGRQVTLVGGAMLNAFIFIEQRCCCDDGRDGETIGPNVRLVMPEGNERDQNGYDTGYYIRCRED